MIHQTHIKTILKNPKKLCASVSNKLNEQIDADSFLKNKISPKRKPTSVLLLMGMHPIYPKRPPVPCFILNKRSQHVHQPGDLCFPGGHIDKRIDPQLAVLLKLPGTPLYKWPFWAPWHNHPSEAKNKLSVYLATSLRESFEEMRLNPLLVRFLGPMAPVRLVMFYRVIYPMVGWVQHQKRFVLNQEVERLVYIPIENFFHPHRYGKYRLLYASSLEEKLNRGTYEDFPCFINQTDTHTDILWGATYRIVKRFLEIVFDFTPPDISSLPVVSGRLERQYLTGTPSLPNRS
jgi:8-oxo-dGTP pyrophosphatase MutT (NUDIX family)